MKICFATNNANKLQEVRQMLEPEYQIVGLEEIGCREELPETQDTLEGNSRQKAEHVWQNYRVSCFADDTGLEVRALNGEPGVYSARYAGPERDNLANIRLLLQNLQDKTDRSARFRTSITLILNGEEHQFDGIVEGTITNELRGQGGFGYDPVFVPEGHSRTFAEMSSEEKNRISHRGRAIQKLVTFLKEQA